MVLPTLALLSFLGCDDSETKTAAGAASDAASAPVLVLDLTQGERILDVIHPANDPAPAAALFHLGTHEGDRLFIAGQRSRVYDGLQGVQFLGAGAKAIAMARHDGQAGVLAWNGSAFVESALYDAVREGVALGGDAGAFAFVGRRGEREVVVRYDGAAFTEVAEGTFVSSLAASPDGKAAVYAYIDGKALWGVDARHYTASPNWYELQNGVWAQTGITATGAEVLVDHAVVGTHEALGAVVADTPRGQVAWAGRTGTEWTVHVANPQATTPVASVGGSTGAPTQLRFHEPSGHLEAVAPTTGGVRFLVGGSGNALTASAVYRAVTLTGLPFADAPIATAAVATGTSTVVLVGGQASKEWVKVERLSTTHEGKNFLYVATDAGGSRAVDAKKEHTVFTAVGDIVRTDADVPVYVGKSAAGQRVVIDGEDAPEVLSVTRILTREGNAVAWLATVTGGMTVGIDLKPGETFETIAGLNLTSKGALWYDGTRAGKRHRVLETEVSVPYTTLGPVQETASARTIAWCGRDLTVTGTGPTASATGRDDIVVGSKVLAQLAFTATGPEAAKAAAPTDLAVVRMVPETDSVVYEGRKDGGRGVGFDASVHGPFEAVKNTVVTPEKNGVAFLAKKGSWAAQLGDERHTELTDASNLRFTLNGKELRYDGLRDAKKLTFVGKDEFLAVKAETLNADGSMYAFAGQQPDGWHVSVSEPGVATRTTSAAFTEVSGLQWTPDGFGVDAIVADAAGKHVLRKPLGRDASLLAAWTSASFPTYRYAPWGKVAASDATGPSTLPLAGFEKLPANEVFVAVGRSPGNWDATYRVRAIDASGVTIEGELPERVRTKPEGDAEGWTAWLVPLETPYTYGVTRTLAQGGAVPGEVYRETYYRRIEDRGFTAHRRWIGVGRDDATDSLILDARVMAAGGQIGEVLPHPDVENDTLDHIAFSVTRPSEDASRPSDTTQGWTLVNADTRQDQLGWIRGSLASAEWTDLSLRGEHTLVWNGYENGASFTGVGAERYDSVRSVTVAPATGSLGYIGRRVHRESVWVSGKHGDWFSKVRDLSFQGPQDTPVYIAEHIYGHDTDSAARDGMPAEKDTVLPTHRRLAAIQHGERRTGWRDAIGNLVPADTLEATVYTAAQDGTWAVYTGDVAAKERWQELAWFVRTLDGSGGLHTHFLGRDDKGWVEVHDGKPGTRVDAIRTEPVTEVIPSALAAVGRTHDGTEAHVLVDEEGRYDYVGLVGDEQVFVHQSAPSGAVRTVENVWYFAEGATVAVRSTEGNKVRLTVNGKVSEPYAKIGDPVYSEATGDVHAIAEPAVTDEMREALQRAAPPKEKMQTEKAAVATLETLGVAWDGVRQVLLRNGEAVSRGWEVADLTTVDRGTRARVSVGGAWRLYYNGDMSDPFDSLLEEPSVFLDTLANSRHRVEKDGRTWVAGRSALPQPYDAVDALFRTKVGDSEVTLWTGDTGRIRHLVIDDADRLAVEKLESFGAYGKLLRAAVVDANTSFVQIGEERVEAVSLLRGARAELDGKAFTPIALLRDEQRWLREGELQARPAWAVWDVRGEIVEVPPAKEGEQPGKAARWTWLEGTLDRTAATLTVREAKLDLTIGDETQPTEWADLPIVDLAAKKKDGPEEDANPLAEIAFTEAARLDPKARKALVSVVTEALKAPRLKVVVEPTGTATTFAERRLGRQRMQTVVDYLQSRGLAADRIERSDTTGTGVRVTTQLPPPPRPRVQYYVCGYDYYDNPMYCPM